MEDTLRDSGEYHEDDVHYSLNPCFNGRYSQRINPIYNKKLQCLNPCFNGRYSQSDLFCKDWCMCVVLILVLMEDTLRDIKSFGGLWAIL